MGLQNRNCKMEQHQDIEGHGDYGSTTLASHGWPSRLRKQQCRYHASVIPAGTQTVRGLGYTNSLMGSP